MLTNKHYSSQSGELNSEPASTKEQTKMESTNKGGWCPYTDNLFCQGGFCSECHVALRMSGRASQIFKLFKLFVEYNGNKTLEELNNGN